MNRSFTAGPFAVALLLLLGCSNTPEGMTHVSGTVSWNGKPLSTGYITFEPVDSGVSQACKIEEGKFSLHATIGSNVVRIESTKPVAFIETMNQQAFKQFIPEEFNTRSTLQEELIEGKGNQLTFDLKGSEA